jgi:hypothetical protein
VIELLTPPNVPDAVLAVSQQWKVPLPFLCAYAENPGNHTVLGMLADWLADAGDTVAEECVRWVIAKWRCPVTHYSNSREVVCHCGWLREADDRWSKSLGYPYRQLMLPRYLWTVYDRVLTWQWKVGDDPLHSPEALRRLAMVWRAMTYSERGAAWKWNPEPRWQSDAD